MDRNYSRRFMRKCKLTAPDYNYPVELTRVMRPVSEAKPGAMKVGLRKRRVIPLASKARVSSSFGRDRRSDRILDCGTRFDGVVDQNTHHQRTVSRTPFLSTPVLRDKRPKFRCSRKSPLIIATAAPRSGRLKPAGNSTPRDRKTVSCRMAATTAAGMRWSIDRTIWLSPVRLDP